MKHAFIFAALIVATLSIGCTRRDDEPAARQIGREAYELKQKTKEAAKEVGQGLREASREAREGWNEAKGADDAKPKPMPPPDKPRRRE